MWYRQKEDLLKECFKSGPYSVSRPFAGLPAVLRTHFKHNLCPLELRWTDRLILQEGNTYWRWLEAMWDSLFLFHIRYAYCLSLSQPFSLSRSLTQTHCWHCHEQLVLVDAVHEAGTVVELFLSKQKVLGFSGSVNLRRTVGTLPSCQSVSLLRTPSLRSAVASWHWWRNTNPKVAFRD